MAEKRTVDMRRAVMQMSAHAQAHEARQKSRVEKGYSAAMRDSTRMLNALAEHGSFDDMLQMTLVLVRQDLERYSRNEAVRNSVQDGLNDLQAGISDYKTLRENPGAYFQKRYVKREMTGGGDAVPVDSMRKALRGQASRAAAYAASPMGNDEEREFQKARHAMIRHSERLYDQIQRECRKELEK